MLRGKSLTHNGVPSIARTSTHAEERATQFKGLGNIGHVSFAHLATASGPEHEHLRQNGLEVLEVQQRCLTCLLRQLR